MQENKLYVGNLPYSTTQDQLSEVFSQFGEVIEAVIITDRNTGRSKGFGFVTMANNEAAQAAIAGMNGQEMEGRALVVNVARPKKED
ncbi:RNA-binding protein [candidate division WWE3 bacterium]|uniref:RNA-binding protein n=1 Tax=candidate division WWE3 bacterium TaxID=2053526 RepID=A0A955LG80_UNCKA|nr:RNA-binding protein [candidate division WWE3 bacterium]